jgi:hypothetical protein
VNPLNRISERLAPHLKKPLLNIVCWMINVTDDDRSPAYYEDCQVWMPRAEPSARERGQLQTELKGLAEDVTLILLLFSLAGSYYVAGAGLSGTVLIGAALLLATAYVVWISARNIDLPEIRTAKDGERA